MFFVPNSCLIVPYSCQLIAQTRISNSLGKCSLRYCKTSNHFILKPKDLLLKTIAIKQPVKILGSNSWSFYVFLHLHLSALRDGMIWVLNVLLFYKNFPVPWTMSVLNFSQQMQSSWELLIILKFCPERNGVKIISQYKIYFMNFRPKVLKCGTAYDVEFWIKSFKNCFAEKNVWKNDFVPCTIVGEEGKVIYTSWGTSYTIFITGITVTLSLKFGYFYYCSSAT